MGQKTAKIISILFHPLLIPTYAILILFNTDSHYLHVLPNNYKLLLLAFVSLFTFFLPAIAMFFMVKLRIVDSLEMNAKKERSIPLVVVALFFYGTYHLLRQIPVNSVFTIFMLGATLLVLFSLLINYFYKISIHMMALGGLLGTMLGYSFLIHQDIRIYLYLIILVTGITGTSRLRLNAHTPSQVYSGFLLGLTTILLLFYFV
jgi:membrane-associated phospholipid phosphatase